MLRSFLSQDIVFNRALEESSGVFKNEPVGKLGDQDAGLEPVILVAVQHGRLTRRRRRAT
jgi:hypothetical protein